MNLTPVKMLDRWYIYDEDEDTVYIKHRSFRTEEEARDFIEFVYDYRLIDEMPNPPEDEIPDREQERLLEELCYKYDQLEESYDIFA